MSQTISSASDLRAVHAAPRARILGTEKERAMLLALLLDLGILVPYVAIAVWANSLTLYGELARALLLVGLEVYLLLLLRRIQRRRLPGYDFGTGNLEQFGNLVVGASMILAALWMVASIALRWASPPEQVGDGLLFGVIITTANLALNAWSLRCVWLAGRDGTSIILAGQIRARLSKTVSSAMVVLVMLVNAVAGGHWIGAAADLVGAALVVCVMVTLGASLCRKALPPLVDRTLDEARQIRINQVLAGRFDAFDALGPVRSRCNGGGAAVEIHLGFAATRSLGEVQAVAGAVRADIEQLIAGAEVSVVPFAVPGSTSPASARP
jgi:divalent metal cation (Fe/Co/Zn/Cd) transporter